MQNFLSEEEKKKRKLISEYQKALIYLNIDLKKLNINQLETFSNEELEKQNNKRLSVNRYVKKSNRRNVSEICKR